MVAFRYGCGVHYANQSEQEKASNVTAVCQFYLWTSGLIYELFRVYGVEENQLHSSATTQKKAKVK